MSVWPPIVAHSAEVVGIHPKFSRLLVIRVRFDRPPPPRWRELFEQTDVHASGDGLEGLQLEDASLTLRTQDDALDEAITQAILRIQQANQLHAAEMLGLREASGQATDADQEQRLHHARKRAEALNRVLATGHGRISGAWAMPGQWVPASEQGSH